MKNTKKVLSVALAGALAFGSMGAAFAATPVMDAKTDSKVQEAVKRLSAFGIISGMEDGKFHEEQKVTREQFAKIIVEALGLGNAANAAKGTTKFKDVDASRWSAGYVNVAAGQGLLKGYADGTFKPDAEVSYAEAVTMLVRALGYKDEFLKGTWPGNYVAKAADSKITDGASFSDAAGKADRGTVAVLVDNTLDAKVVKVSEYTDGTIKYGETNKTLLKDKLEISKYENVRVTADKLVDDSLRSGEVRVDFTKDMDADQIANAKNSYKVADSGKTLDVKADVNVRNVMGEEVTVYTDKDNKIVYAEKENDDKASFEYVTEDKGNSGLYLYKLDKEYPFDKDAKVYIYNSSTQKYTLAKLDSNNRLSASDVANVLYHSGKFVIKNNKVIYAEMVSGNEASPWFLVKDNKSDVLTGINDTNEKYSLNLAKDGKKFGNYDGVLVYDQNGNKIDVKDIKAGNIVYVQKQEIDKDKYAVLTVITDNVVKGKLDKVKSDAVTIGGKDYDVAPGNGGFNAYYSIDKDENAKKWNSNVTEWKDDMKDADAAEVTAYLDGAGQVIYLTTEAKASSGYLYGVVTKTYSDNDRIKVYVVNKDGKGEEITYTAEESKNLKAPRKLTATGSNKGLSKTDTWPIPGGASTALYEGSVVKFKLNKKGEISEDEFYMVDKDKYYTMYSKTTGGVTENSDFGKDTIPSEIAGTDVKQTFNVDSKTVIVDAKTLKTNGTITGKVSDDFGVAKWSELAEDKYDGNLKYYVFTDDNNDIDAKAVVFIDAGASTASDAEAVYVIDSYTKGGDDYVKYADSKGVESERKTTNTFADIKKGYIAKIKSDGKIEKLTSDKDYSIMTGKITNRDGDIVTIQTINGSSLGAIKTVKLSDNTVVYEKKDKRSISNLSKGDSVEFVVQNDVSVRVAERLVEGERDAVEAITNPTTPVTPPVTTAASVAIPSTVKIGTTSVANLTLPAGNSAVYKVEAIKADGTLIKAISTFVSKDFTVTDLLLSNLEDSVMVRVLDEKGVVIANGSKVVAVDTIAPTVTVTGLGNGTADVTIAAAATTTITFSEALTATEKADVQAALTSGADKAITYAWDSANKVLTITGHATDVTTFANDVNVTITDAAGNAKVLKLVDSL